MKYLSSSIFIVSAFWMHLFLNYLKNSNAAAYNSGFYFYVVVSLAIGLVLAYVEKNEKN